MVADAEIHARDVTGRVLGTNDLARADALFRGTVESLHQAIYLYEPIWASGRIVDLLIVYCNAAALALPFTEEIVPGTLASNVFKSPELAMADAEVAWRVGESAKYSIDRDGLIDGVERMIRYEVQTRRVGDYILQTSTDHTIADELRRSEARQRLILDALTEGVTLLAPLFNAAQDMIGTRVLYSNAAALRLRALGVGIFAGVADESDELDVVRRTWASREPALSVIDRLGPPGNGRAADEPELYLEFEANRVGELVVQVVRDRTDEVRSAREREAAEHRFRGTIEAVSEAVGIWQPIRDAEGTLVDLVLRYANPSMALHSGPGLRASAMPADTDLINAGRKALEAAGRPVTLNATITSRGETRTWRVGVVEVDGEIVTVGSDISDITRHADELQWHATHQRQTGLPNFDGLTQAIDARAQSHAGSYALIWIALTELETIRPTFGFAAGDAALVSAAETVARIAQRHEAIAAQPEDSALAILIPNVSSGAIVQQIAEQVAHELHRPFVSDSMSLLLGAVLGSVIAPLHGTDADTLIRRAKTAATYANKDGVNVLRWRAGLGAEQIEQASLLGQFEGAMERGEIFFEYQPKLDANTRGFVGAEALVRWLHPERGRIPPDGFIKGVEASALCRPFTLWAIRSALSAWEPLAIAHPASKVAVNVPVPLISDLDFLEQLADELVRLNVDPSRLQVEITERGLHGNIDNLRAGLEQIKMLGVSIALDDFGTGQSSLAFLRHLAIDEVKVDRAFIDGVHVDPANRAIVTACVTIARTNAMRVTAEGVETEQELAASAELGCDFAQGYLLGRPASIDRLIEQYVVDALEVQT